MMCRISRTPVMALIVGVCLELSIRSGICDDSQLSEIGKESRSLSNKQEHSHKWKGWDDWVPATSKRQEHEAIVQQVPLSLSEQEKRSQRSRNSRSAGSTSSKNSTEKTGTVNIGEGSNLNALNTPSNIAPSAVDNFADQWFMPLTPNYHMEYETPRDHRAIYLDNLHRPDGPNIGKPEREAKRGVVDWLARLIGVQGKTLGEFLREYQVHVLYDLAFTFFKWIFFLYAGLLIP